MKSREYDVRRLDVETFAKAGGSLAGQWPLASLERLADAAHPQARPTADDLVAWSVRGETVPVKGGAPEIWLHVQASASLALECQRCLQPVVERVEAQRRFLFVAGEDTAAELDAQTEDDVLALTRALDVQELVEDELLLSLPVVPRHERCPTTLPTQAADPGAEATAKENPFAALAALKARMSGQ